MLPNMTKVDAIMREVAAREVLPRFQNLSHAEIREKNPGDIVTIADEKAEGAPGANAIGNGCWRLSFAKNDRQVICCGWLSFISVF